MSQAVLFGVPGCIGDRADARHDPRASAHGSLKATHPAWQGGRPYHEGATFSDPNGELSLLLRRRGHFWGHGTKPPHKLAKVDGDPSRATVGIHKNTKPSKRSSASS
jgi:hypothetical protein